MHKKYQAFTLIELLVVIAIVGVLSGFIFVSMTSAINSAKDTKRKADLSSIEKALLVYGANHGGTYPYSALDTYPCNLTGSTNLCTNTNLAGALSSYLGALPTDPNGTSYTYTGTSDASSFVLTGTLSNGNSYYYSSPNLTWTETTSPFMGWGYKKTVTLSAGLTQDYQIKLTIPFGTGGCESHCNADFSDLRFASTGGTVLNYWIESYTASTTVTVWVKALNGSSNFNMYYGKTGVTTTANGNNTFELFDDFLGSTLDTTKWDTVVLGTNSAIAVNASLLQMYMERVNEGGAGIVAKNALPAGNYSVEARLLRNYVRNAGEIGLLIGLTDKTSRDTTYYGNYSSNTAAANLYSYTGISRILQASYTSSAVNAVSPTSYAGYWARVTAKINNTEKKTYASFAYNGYTYNDVLITNAGTTSLSALYPFIHYGEYNPGGAKAANADWVFVRKYQSSEPTPSIGGELTN
jgi:prepilin-type N-terminal cleavage/methylation domain-containing protein